MAKVIIEAQSTGPVSVLKLAPAIDPGFFSPGFFASLRMT
jgi:hypothetical protein